jgi:predicted HTH transcriptional regulator
MEANVAIPLWLKLLRRIQMVEAWGRRIPLILEMESDSQRNPKEIILNILKEQPSLSIREIAEQSGMSVHSVQHQINRLKEDGVIKHVGPTKGGRWEGFS